MAFYKTLSALIIALSVFSSSVFSMQNENDLLSNKESNHSQISILINEDVDETTPIIKKKKSCLHWGLSRWVSGIGEYIKVMFCCNVKKKEGVYRKRFSNIHEDYEMSDCYFDYSVWGDRQSCTKAFCCCPCATILHLCCLPFACCKPSKKDPEEINCIKTLGYIPPIPINISNISENERKKEIPNSYPQVTPTQPTYDPVKQHRENINRQERQWNDYKRYGTWS